MWSPVDAHVPADVVRKRRQVVLERRAAGGLPIRARGEDQNP